MRLTNANIDKFYNRELVIRNKDSNCDVWYYDTRTKRIKWVWFDSDYGEVIKREDGYTQSVRTIFEHRRVKFDKIDDYLPYVVEHYSKRCLS